MLDSNSRTRYKNSIHSETIIPRRRERGISSSSKRLQKIWSSASHKWYALQRTRLSVCMDPDTIETPRSTRSALWVAQLISLAYETLWWMRLCKVSVMKSQTASAVMADHLLCMLSRKTICWWRQRSLLSRLFDLVEKSKICNDQDWVWHYCAIDERTGSKRPASVSYFVSALFKRTFDANALNI